MHPNFPAAIFLFQHNPHPLLFSPIIPTYNLALHNPMHITITHQPEFAFIPTIAPEHKRHPAPLQHKDVVSHSRRLRPHPNEPLLRYEKLPMLCVDTHGTLDRHRRTTENTTAGLGGAEAVEEC